MVTTIMAEPWRLCRDGGCCRGGLGGDGKVVVVVASWRCDVDSVEMAVVVVMVSARVAVVVRMVSAGVDGGDDIGGSVVMRCGEQLAGMQILGNTQRKPERLDQEWLSRGGCAAMAAVVEGGLGGGGEVVVVVASWRCMEMAAAVVMVSAGVAAVVGMVSAGVDGGDDVGGSVMMRCGGCWG
ncbi:hypothetical protein Tco_0940620 [Tanacetum coccineum]|uniref:Uncharacterized protein n=1 Tax=Tanacetum coccineum TaxID=301880 RepID=A0ABQ5DNH7_9ASTR